MNYIVKILLNSLSGRFGMDDSFVNTSILSKNDYNSFEKLGINNIKDVIILDDNYLVQSKNSQKDLETLLDNGTQTQNVNVAPFSLASFFIKMKQGEGVSAITFYSRIYMAQFKNNNNYELYYNDIDSIYIDRPLDDSLISNIELGKMKLERICNKAVFLAPPYFCLFLFLFFLA